MTRENRLQYIYLVAHYRLTKQIKRQSAAFFEGLSEIIDPKWLRCVSLPDWFLGWFRGSKKWELTGVRIKDVQPARTADPARGRERAH